MYLFIYFDSYFCTGGLIKHIVLVDDCKYKHECKNFTFFCISWIKTVKCPLLNIVFCLKKNFTFFFLTYLNYYVKFCQNSDKIYNFENSFLFIFIRIAWLLMTSLNSNSILFLVFELFDKSLNKANVAISRSCCNQVIWIIIKKD